MNIITVIPLTRSKVADTLSYFTGSDVPVGAVVSVPLRSKSIHAIVTESRPAEDLKMEIKRAPFEIKKLQRVRAAAFFPAHYIAACKQIAEHYATTLGAVINTLVSDVLLEQAHKIPAPVSQKAFPIKTGASMTIVKDQTFAIQGDDPDRLGSWRSLIRQEFAHKKSIVMYVPTIEDAKTLSVSLEKGIEGYIFTLHSGLTPKKIIETWTAISEANHPVVIVATGSFSILPRSDIETIVIERENARGWISQKAPYLDLRYALEMISRKGKKAVFLADTLLRTETLHRLDEHEVDQGSPFKWRSISTATDVLVNMKTPEFKVLSKELTELIQFNHDESTHLFILAVRRGHSPITTCADCGTIVACKNCKAPVVLHTSSDSGKNFFMCHKCGERRSANETCVVCNSWKLVPLGIGIERVVEEIREKFPGFEVQKIDADTTKTDKQARDAADKFRSKPGSILVGTEMSLQYISDPVDHIAVVSLDSLFSLPDFRIQEKIMYLLIRLRAQAMRTFMVQTRKPEEKVFDYGLKGNLSDFHRTTHEERKQFSYPPFTLLIKFTIEGKKEAIAERMAAIVKQVEPYELDIFPAFTSSGKGNSGIHGLIKVEMSRWPDLDLIATLRGLPPDVSVKINPESLL